MLHANDVRKMVVRSVRAPRVFEAILAVWILGFYITMLVKLNVFTAPITSKLSFLAVVRPS